MTIANELPDVVDPEGRYRSAFSYHPFDVEIAKADGIYLIDTKGRKYIDVSGGPMAVNIGHGHPRMKRAIAEQMERYAYVHPTIANPKRAELCDAIAAVAPGTLNTVYLASGGSEAVESAIKIARGRSGTRTRLPSSFPRLRSWIREAGRPSAASEYRTSTS